MDYHKKYLKYKNKYLELQKLVGGKSSEISETVDNILKKIYNYLDSKKICFDRGAFIFELTDNNMSKTLRNMYANGITRSIAITHNFHQSNKEHAPQRLCNPNDCIAPNTYNISGHPMKEIKMLLTSNCTVCSDTLCEKKENAPKEVILMYIFKVSINGVQKEYLYMKLEGKSTQGLKDKIMHSINAVKRYMMKSGIEPFSRREDSIKDYHKNMKPFVYDIYKTETLAIVNEDNEKMINIFTNDNDKNEIKESLNFYTKNIRTGRELFIPAKLMDLVFNS